MARMIFKQKLTLNKAGELLSSISHGDLERITHLEIEGKINADDFETMRDDMYSLTHINIRECDIEAIDGYGADKIPDMAFSHYIGHDDIGDKVYQAKRWLRKVILPKSATVIGKQAFCNSKRLRRVELPKNLFCICDEAFKGCKELRGSMNFPPSLKSIGEEAFRYCESLKCELLFPDGLTHIGNCAFQYCSKIYDIVLPKSNCTIGAAAFGYCTKNRAKIVIPQGCEKIEPFAFCENKYITSIEMPATCDEIGDRAFGEPLLLEKVIIHAKTPPKLGRGVFTEQMIGAQLLIPEGCYEAYTESDWNEQFESIAEHTRTIELSAVGSLKMLSISNGYHYYIERLVLKGKVGEQDFRTLRTMFHKLTHLNLSECEIEDNQLPVNALLNCDSLVEVLLPQDIHTIGEAAFCGCSSLRTLHFSSALREVGDMAFNGCKSLSAIEFDSTAAPRFGQSVFEGMARKVAIVPNNCTERYQNATASNCDLTYIVERTIRVKGSDRFAAYEKIGECESKYFTHIIIDGIIDQQDFSYIRDNCTSIELLDLRGASIVKYKHHETNTIPENALCVTCYDLLYEQYGMNYLKKVILPKGVTKIGKYAFGENVEVIAAEDYCPF